jgi:5-methylcytosine-specific restriction endonuclease McrA
MGIKKLHGFDKTQIKWIKEHYRTRTNREIAEHFNIKPWGKIDTLIYKLRKTGKIKVDKGDVKENKKRESYLSSEKYKQFKETIRARDNYKCIVCGMAESDSLLMYGIRLHVHHIVPRVLKIDDSESNLQTVCFRCHINIHRQSETALFKKYANVTEPDIPLIAS